MEEDQDEQVDREKDDDDPESRLDSKANGEDDMEHENESEEEWGEIIHKIGFQRVIYVLSFYFHVFDFIRMVLQTQ